MSSSINELRRRIKSISSTEQMTTAMKTVAVSKYNRAISALEASRPYFAECASLLSAFGGIKSAGSGEEPKGRALGRPCYVLVTANRGLCGSYNTDLVHLFESTVQKAAQGYSLIVCGRWGKDYFTRAGSGSVLETFDISDIPKYGEAAELTKFLEELYNEGEASEIYFVSQTFRNVLTQKPEVTRLLPSDPGPGRKDPENSGGLTDERQIPEPDPAHAPPDPAHTSPGPAYASPERIYMPGREELEKSIKSTCLAAEVYNTLLASAAGAHGAMLVSMRTASENSANLLDTLELRLNHLRQMSVTTEVLELAGSAIAAEHDEQGAAK